jgi:four helix bundle protein
MSTFKKFEEIECWKRARELTRQVYKISNGAAFAKDFGLKNQIRRAAVSVMSNIAEGHDRNGTAEFIQFLATAKGSAAEVRCQLMSLPIRIIFKRLSFSNSMRLPQRSEIWWAV